MSASFGCLRITNTKLGGLGAGWDASAVRARFPFAGDAAALAPAFAGDADDDDDDDDDEGEEDDTDECAFRFPLGEPCCAGSTVLVLTTAPLEAEPLLMLRHLSLRSTFDRT